MTIFSFLFGVHTALFAVKFLSFAGIIKFSLRAVFGANYQILKNK
jgi:hypothetical protein